MDPHSGNDDPHQEYGAEGHGQPDYDPGAAFVDENQTYDAVDPAAYEAEQAYYDPNAVQAEAAYTYEEPQEMPVENVVPPVRSVRPSVPKKKVVRSAAARKPATKKKARRPAPKPVVYDSGLSFGTVFLTLIALGLLAIVVMIGLPRDLSAVVGYPGDALDADQPRNLLSEAQKAMIDRDVELVFSEEEVNRYLRSRLTGEQKGLMASFVTFRGICVDFSPQKAQVVIEREIFGLPLTMEVELAAEEFRRQTVYKPVSWTLGRISLGRNTVKPVADLFVRLRESLIDEYHVLQQMPSVRFEENRVVVDSRI